jgi:hypothetical protein
MDFVRDGIAYVCAHLDELNETLDAPGPLDQVLAALRSGENPATALEALHEAVQRAGDPNGVLGRGTRAMMNLPGLPRGKTEIVYLCPESACNRFEWCGTRCALYDAELRTERLP